MVLLTIRKTLISHVSTHVNKRHCSSNQARGQPLYYWFKDVSLIPTLFSKRIKLETQDYKFKSLNFLYGIIYYR